MTEVDSFTIARDGRDYRVSVRHDEDAQNPRDDYDHPATQFFVTSYTYSRWDTYVDELSGDAGDALRHFLIPSQYSDDRRSAEDVERRFKKWRAITGSPAVLVTGSDHGYVQGAEHDWYALVDTDVLTRDGYGCTPEHVAKIEADEYAAYAYGDVFGVVVTLSGTEIDDGALWGIVDRHGDYVREVATELIDSHEKFLVDQANRAGAGFVGVL